MVESGFFSTRVAMYRTVPGFVAQAGISGDPEIAAHWREKTISDDKQWLGTAGTHPFKRGYIAFAGRKHNTRSTDFFIAYDDLSLGRAPWEVPCGHLVGDDSFTTLDSFYTGYYDGTVKGQRPPSQHKIHTDGIAYLQEQYPLLDYITSCEEVSSPQK